MLDFIKNERLGFDDLFNSDVSSLFEDISLSEIGFCLLIAFLLAAFIFVVYRLNYKGTMYSYPFNASLVGMCIITAVMMMAISSNIVLSLGMVGALSIVRFRTPLKDPSDTVYVYWAICAGITAGVGIYGIALVGNLLIGIVITVLAKINFASRRTLLVIKVKIDGQESVEEKLSNKQIFIKSKFVGKNDIEYNVVIKKESLIADIEKSLHDNSNVLAFTRLNYEE